MSLAHPDLLTILEAVEIHSEERYVIGLEPREVLPRSTDAEETGHPLVQDLAANIYTHLYINPSAKPPIRNDGRLSHRQFLADLSEANSGSGTMEPGWTVRQKGEGSEYVVTRKELNFWVPASGVRVQSGRIEPGEACQVWVPKELRYLVPGYYYALGDARSEKETDPSQSLENDTLLRYYWHLTASVASRFTAKATRVLNEAKVPFELKVLSDPAAYYRADAGVLYLRRRQANAAGELIARIYEETASGLRPTVPLFTRKLADGLALAEDPGKTVSFGIHRCQLVARGLWRSFARKEFDISARAAILEEVFREEGLDPNHPYLGAGSRLDDLRRAAPAFRRPPVSPPRQKARIRLSPLEAASRIGESLCRSAHWDGPGRLCNWMGRSASEVGPGGDLAPTSAALEADIYGGSAGIALFLARLHALTGEPQFRRTAVGAAARSIRQVERRPSSIRSPLSFFTGSLGVAYVAHQVGLLTGEDSLYHPAETLLDQLTTTAFVDHPLDFLGGHAGAIPALLALSRTLGSSRDRELAIALGEELCRLAVRHDSTWTWHPDRATGPGIATVPLTGLSHGAAGMALALLELHAATNQAQFLQAATGAFHYEDSLFDSKRLNWPDLRGSDTPAKSSHPPIYGEVWCQGAPGIALARLRASVLDPSRAKTHREMARAALTTTLRAIETNLEAPRHDTSICHGLAGLIEVVLTAGRVLDESSYRDRAAGFAATLIERHSASGDWPSGIASGGPNPSMMIGLTGIAYTLLRIHDPGRVPSIFFVD